MVWGYKKSDISELKKKEEKLQLFYILLNHWLELKQHNKSIVPYFQENNYKKIIIYGMKELGERLCDELSESDIEVVAAMDRNADKIYAPVKLLFTQDEVPQADVIVVTAPFYFGEIERELKKRTNIPIVDLLDIVFYK